MTKTLKYKCSYCADKAPELCGCPCVVEISEKWANKMHIILKCPIRSDFDKVDFKLINPTNKGMINGKSKFI